MKYLGIIFLMYLGVPTAAITFAGFAIYDMGGTFFNLHSILTLSVFAAVLPCIGILITITHKFRKTIALRNISSPSLSVGIQKMSLQKSSFKFLNYMFNSTLLRRFLKRQSIIWDSFFITYAPAKFYDNDISTIENHCTNSHYTYTDAGYYYNPSNIHYSSDQQ